MNIEDREFTLGLYWKDKISQRKGKLCIKN